MTNISHYASARTQIVGTRSYHLMVADSITAKFGSHQEKIYNSVISHLNDYKCILSMKDF